MRETLETRLPVNHVTVDHRQGTYSEMGSSQRFAVGASAAVACLMVGLLLGVLASGAAPSQVFSVLRNPVAPASGATHPAATRPPVTLTVMRTLTTSQTEPPHTVIRTVTHTETTPGSTRTITEPATTVTVTVTQTTTATQPGTTGP
jgi:hypothetical protein